MKSKTPRTYEQYIVKRLNDLEYETAQLASEKNWANSTIETKREQIRRMGDDIKFLISLHTPKTFQNELEGNEPEAYIDGRTVWERHSKSDYDRLMKLIDFYTEPEMPF